MPRRRKQQPTAPPVREDGGASSPTLLQRTGVVESEAALHAARAAMENVEEFDAQVWQAVDSFPDRRHVKKLDDEQQDEFMQRCVRTSVRCTTVLNRVLQVAEGLCGAPQAQPPAAPAQSQAVSPLAAKQAPAAASATLVRGWRAHAARSALPG